MINFITGLFWIVAINLVLKVIALYGYLRYDRKRKSDFMKAFYEEIRKGLETEIIDIIPDIDKETCDTLINVCTWPK